MEHDATESDARFLPTRRDFHRLAAAGVMAAACSGRAATDGPPVMPLSYAVGASRPVVVAGVRRGTEEGVTAEAVRRAALAATDFRWLSRGDTVLVKPVCNSGNPYPATTDPIALQAMIALLREKGAGRVIVGDMSGVQFVRFGPDRLTGSSRALMTRNGIAPACEAAGAEVHAFEEAGWDGFFDEVPRRGENWRRPLLLPRVLQEVDHVVLMPRCSRHLLAGSTLGLKAAVGWWRHDSRLEYHHDAATFAEKTAESNTTPTLVEKQRLVLTSATRVLTTFGPDQGFVHGPDTGLIIASTDVVAHDMVSLAWLLESRQQTPRSAKDGLFDDPFRSATLSDLANRVVTGWLGGFGRAFSAERLGRRDIATVWDDRVLRRAFQVFDGVPRIDLVNADESVLGETIRSLQTAVTLPA
jgi:uncharacterized protein (DUF362 family)